MHEQVFGIGLQKTGTTSLNTALNILGYKSKHFVPEIICKEFYHHGATCNKTLSYRLSNYDILKNYNALTDNPLCVPEIWKDLESTYPDAKFIMTIRNKDKWIKSVIKHINQTNYLKQLERRINNYKNYLPEEDILPTADNIGMLEYVYRIPYLKIDENFLNSYYDEYFHEVIEYFQFKPDKLLVINFENNEGWEELAGFLDLRIPKQAFPHNHKTYPKHIQWIVKNFKPYLPAKIRSNMRMFYISIEKKISNS